MSAETDEAYRDLLFWDTVDSIIPEMDALSRPLILADAGRNALVHEMAKVLLKGRRFGPNLRARCIRTIARQHGLIGQEVEMVIDRQMVDQLAAENLCAGIAEDIEREG